MALSKQNKVPYEFDSLYLPILKLKQVIQSNNQVAAEVIIQGFTMLHYTTFIMTYFNRQRGDDTTKSLIVRELVELIMSCDNYDLQQDQASKLYSYIDSLGKMLNTTRKPYIYIAMYHGYLDAEIYRNIHPDLSIFDFQDFMYITPLIRRGTVSSAQPFQE
jgi:hypothetical protein